MCIRFYPRAVVCIPSGWAVPLHRTAFGCKCRYPWYNYYIKSDLINNMVSGSFEDLKKTRIIKHHLNNHKFTCHPLTSTSLFDDLTEKSMGQDPQKHCNVKNCYNYIRLGWGNTKKRRSKKAGESKTPIRYNVMNMHVQLRYIILASHDAN